ncbi:MAG TPA: TFIIB-type zinc finger domain-containing protein, partial [Candidatus Obscuribacterales bacterium]
MDLKFIQTFPGTTPLVKVTVYAEATAEALELLQAADYHPSLAAPNAGDGQAWIDYTERSLYILGYHAHASNHPSRETRRTAEERERNWLNHRLSTVPGLVALVQEGSDPIIDFRFVYSKTNKVVRSAFLETPSKEVAAALTGHTIQTPSQEYLLGHVEDEEDVLATMSVARNCRVVFAKALTAHTVRETVLGKASRFLVSKGLDPLPEALRVQIRQLNDHGIPAKPVIQWQSRIDRDAAVAALNRIYGKKGLKFAPWIKKYPQYLLSHLILRLSHSESHRPHPLQDILRCGDIESNPGPTGRPARRGPQCSECNSEPKYYCNRCGTTLACNSLSCVGKLQEHANRQSCHAASTYSQH